MGKGALLTVPIRRAIQREMVSLVKELGSQVAVGEALGVSAYAIGKAEKKAVVGPSIFERLLTYLDLDEEQFRRRHVALITDEEAKLPKSRRGVMTGTMPAGPATNNLAIALSEYPWNARLSLQHRGLIARQAIAGRDRHDMDLPVPMWTKVIGRLEELLLEVGADFARMEAATPPSQLTRNDADKAQKKGPPPSAVPSSKRRSAAG